MRNTCAWRASVLILSTANSYRQQKLTRIEPGGIAAIGRRALVVVPILTPVV